MEAKAQAHEIKVDQSTTKEEALNHAIRALELYMDALKLHQTAEEKTRLQHKCKSLMDRAEAIKAAPAWVSPTSQLKYLKAPTSSRSISKQEEIILLEGSKLHGYIFPPWNPLDEATSDRDENDLYTESQEIPLPVAQQAHASGWRRWVDNGDAALPDELHARYMIAAKSHDFVQDATSDCSVVASLCALTTGKVLSHGKILQAIFPAYDERTSTPKLARNGRYSLRLNFNGCFRKVVLDDRFPASTSARSLHVLDRNNPRLLWPLLLEKAYLKVRGGYDFPGSNSGTDLYAMTGWIPEQIFLQSNRIASNQLWHRIAKAYAFGDVMITLGTGILSKSDEARLDLVTEHDYAVLDIAQNDGQCRLLVKNPWSDECQRAHDAAIDTLSEPEKKSRVRRELSPGSRWMNWSYILQHFNSLYLNWNPGLFTHRQDFHFKWAIQRDIPQTVLVTTPQYSIASASGGDIWILLSRHSRTAERALQKSTATQGHDDQSSETQQASSLGFMSMYIYEADNLLLSNGTLPYHRGEFVDSPNTLVRISPTPNRTYTIVPAQQSLPLPQYNLTMSFFSTSPLKIEPSRSPHSHTSIVSGAWGSQTAGGNISSPLYHVNPQYSLSIPKTSPATALTILCYTTSPPHNTPMNLVIAYPTSPQDLRIHNLTTRSIIASSGEYTTGAVLLELPPLQPGTYTLIPSTFHPNQQCAYTIHVRSSHPDVLLRPIPAEDAGRLRHQLPALHLDDEAERAIARLSLQRITQLHVIANAPTPQSLAASATRGESSSSSSAPLTAPIHPGSSASANPTPTPATRPLLRISIEQGQGPNRRVLAASSAEGTFSDALGGVRTPAVHLRPDVHKGGGGGGGGYAPGAGAGLWLVVERLGGGGGGDAELGGGGGREDVAAIRVETLSDAGVDVGPWEVVEA